LNLKEKALQKKPGSSQNFGEVLDQRFRRRSLLGGLMKAIPATALMAGASAIPVSGEGTPARVPAAAPDSPEAKRDSRIQFQAVQGSTADAIEAAPGYRSAVLIKWGDPLFNDSPAFDPAAQTAAGQARQFGYNNDWMGYFPLPAHDVDNPRHGLLAVNHEYTNPELMFRNWQGLANQTKEETEIEIEAHGLSVVEVMRDSTGTWSYVVGSRYNRRITGTTPATLTGPAAGSEWLRTSADPTGRRVLGTLNNCAGGQTPWGTILSGEENFHQYFSNAGRVENAQARAIHAGYGMPEGNGEYPWARHVDRFDMAKEPNEPFRFGWVVEFDPYQPQSGVKKRTALGRIRHEGCTITVARNGQIVAYTGDDERFQFAYKYVSKGKYNAFDRFANDALLDEGTLYVAKFESDGTGEWLPLVFGQGPLTPANGFSSQADVLVNTRGAAKLLGATAMDRPEDMETNPVNGKVYIALTNNTRRTDRDKDAANPRANNRWGHIIELTEESGDHSATRFYWEIFILCGNPAEASHGTFFAGYDPSQVSSIACPDNITFDSKGNLWIATDGQPGVLGKNDGIYAVPTDGTERGYVRQLVSGVKGAETASLVFNPDDTALFVSIQHPGEGGKWTLNEADLVSKWPDGRGPNKPGVVVVTKAEGSPVVGS
jgi:secreted PhoX family phosphatase